MNDTNDAYTIPEFCASHRISRATFYNLPLSDRPAVIAIGAKRIITRESAAAWRRKMEARTAATETAA